MALLCDFRGLVRVFAPARDEGEVILSPGWVRYLEDRGLAAPPHYHPLHGTETGDAADEAASDRVACALAGVSFALAAGTVLAVETGSPFVRIDATEALYASAAYFVLRALLVEVRPIVLAPIVLGLALGFGVSALYTFSWLDRGRDTLFVRIFAGESLETLDLARAGAGVLVAFVVDSLVVMRRLGAGQLRGDTRISPFRSRAGSPCHGTW